LTIDSVVDQVNEQSYFKLYSFPLKAPM
jgi:hypothetical protein